MKCLIILSVVIVAVSSQFPPGGYGGDPSLARILNDQRAHHISGDFRHAVKQEDGTQIEEVASSADGTRRGSYSYVNDQGQTESVKWEAGPGGFRVLGANNQPAHPMQTAAYKAAADNLAAQHAAIRARVAEQVRLDALKPKPVTAAPKRAPVQQWSPQPQKQWVEPKQQQWAAPKQQQWVAPKQQQWVPQQQPKPVQPQYVPVQQPVQPVQQFAPVPAPTPAPKRFFPPGQLAFSRNQLGYQYSFSS